MQLGEDNEERAMASVEYGYQKNLGNVSFEDAVARVTDALKSQGFGVLTEIDVQATMKKKLDLDYEPYVILGACNPPLAHRALSAQPEIGLLLPCNVIVRQTTEGVVAGFASPKAMLSFVKETEVGSVAAEADQKIRGALDVL
jgi:uncharacterized protein (DUF302 family)